MRVVSGIVTTLVSTSPDYPVGERFSVSQPAADLPPSIWMYVKATVALAEGDVCAWTSSATGTAYVHPVIHTTEIDQVPANIAGVAQHTVALNSYGFIQIGGIGNVKTAGSVAATTALAYPNAATGRGDAIGTGSLGNPSFAIVVASGASPQKCFINLAR